MSGWIVKPAAWVLRIMIQLRLPDQPIDRQNWIGKDLVPAGAPRIQVDSPYFGRRLGTVPDTDEAGVDAVVQAAKAGFGAWSATPLKERCHVLLNFRAQLLAQLDGLADLAALESGKTPAEAKAGLLKGIEVLEFASSLQNIDAGHIHEVSRGVHCHNVREPLGVVAGVTPFNFPAMVPMWMFPIAIAAGNAFVLKPSEVVPFTAGELARIGSASGLPAGVLSTANGGARTVQHLIGHPEVQAIAFVGSSPVAKIIYQEAGRRGKRALCLGGAKNCLIVAPDHPEDLTVGGVVSSFTGCAGQRCMAASLLLLIDDSGSGGGRQSRLLDSVCRQAAAVKVGVDMGAIISAEALDRHHRAIESATAQGAKLLVDGRSCRPPEAFQGGHWLGATVLDGVTPDMDCANQELFGPILSVIRVRNLSEALRIEAALPYGNATSIFTASGQTARFVSEKATAAMVGINIGVPVPREPFSFGGNKESKYGGGDITGTEGLSFWTKNKKITSKWSAQSDHNWMS